MLDWDSDPKRVGATKPPPMNLVTPPAANATKAPFVFGAEKNSGG